MAAFEAVDITGRAFAMRLANLLVATRTRSGLGVGSVARASGGRFSKTDLKAFERGDRTLDEDTLDELAQLYRCDLGEILPLRLPVVVGTNRISAGGVHQDFDGSASPDALLAAYLTLVRTLRRQRKAPVVDLRRDDITVLASSLNEPSETVVHRLATLMNATQTKRTAMVGVFATGAAVIGLVGTALAVGGTASTPTDTLPNTGVTTTSVATTNTASAPIDTAAVTSTTATNDTSVVTTAPVTNTTVRTNPKPTSPPPSTTTMPPLIETNLTTTTVIVADGPPPVPVVP